jgi:hypothetical protein
MYIPTLFTATKIEQFCDKFFVGNFTEKSLRGKENTSKTLTRPFKLGWTVFLSVFFSFVRPIELAYRFDVATDVFESLLRGLELEADAEDQRDVVQHAKRLERRKFRL